MLDVLDVLDDRRAPERREQTKESIGVSFMTVAELCYGAEKSARALTDADMLVAATTLQRGTVLIAGNSRHFDRISGLKVENRR